jgi:hypothetical protein
LHEALAQLLQLEVDAEGEVLARDGLDIILTVLIAPLDAPVNVSEKDLGTLVRVPHTGTTDSEAASDVEIPETSAPAKRKRAAPSGPASKRARETPSAAATRRAEKEKQCLKQIDTSKQS